MFLTANELNIGDFLKAIQFIPPTGMDVTYFISPEALQQNPTGFVKEDEDIPVSQSVTYSKKDPNTKIQQSDTPEDYAIIDSKKIVNSGAKMPVMPQVTPIEGKQCPFIDVLSDDNLGTDLLLKEDFGPFYKNTLFHCEKLN